MAIYPNFMILDARFLYSRSWYERKTNKDGSLNLIHMQDEVDKEFGKDECNVVCTITDPYVVHHGSFGSFVTIYLKDKSKINEVMDYIKKIDGVEMVINKEKALRN